MPVGNAGLLPYKMAMISFAFWTQLPALCRLDLRHFHRYQTQEMQQWL